MFSDDPMMELAYLGVWHGREAEMDLSHHPHAALYFLREFVSGEPTRCHWTDAGWAATEAYWATTPDDTLPLPPPRERAVMLNDAATRYVAEAAEALVTALATYGSAKLTYAPSAPNTVLLEQALALLQRWLNPPHHPLNGNNPNRYGGAGG